MDISPRIPQQKNQFILTMKKFLFLSEWLTARDFFIILLSVLMVIVFGGIIAVLRKDFLGFVKPSPLKIFTAILLFIVFGVPFFITVCPAFPLPPGAVSGPCGSDYVFRKVWDLKEPIVMDATYQYHFSLVYSVIFLVMWYFVVSSVVQFFRLVFRRYAN